MDDILRDVNTVVGVTGSFVCNEDGLLLARSMPSVFDGAMLSVACRTAAQTAAGLEVARRRKLLDIDLLYGDGRVLIKKFRGGCLCVLCVRTINVPLLNLTAGVALKKLSEMTHGSEASAGAVAPETKAAPEAVTPSETARPAAPASGMSAALREALEAKRTMASAAKGKSFTSKGEEEKK